MIEFQIIKLMAVIFTPDFNIGDKLSLINLFQELSETKFDGELISIPIPQDAPAEIPRIILNSRDETWRLEVSLQRTNIIFLQPLAPTATTPSMQDFAEVIKKIFKPYKEKNNIRVQRLAFVTERFSEISEKSPSQFIADKYCKEEYLKAPFNRTSAFEIHSLKKYEYQSFFLNSWVRIKSANLKDGKSSPILMVINDINTLANEEGPNIIFTGEDIVRFFDIIPDHLDNILNLYFKS